MSGDEPAPPLGQPQLSVAAPVADVTLGAINITLNSVSAGTWTGGGTFYMNKSVQV